MKLPNIDIDFYRTEEIIGIINREFGRGSLTLSMLKYMRDVLRIIPKPIRMKHTKGKGGAPSYYTKETLDLLRKIMDEYTNNDKILKDISVEYKDKIHHSFNQIHDLYRHIRSVRGDGSEALNKPRPDEAPTQPLSSYIGKLEEAVAAIKKGSKDEEVYAILEDFMKHFVRKYRSRLL